MSTSRVRRAGTWLAAGIYLAAIGPAAAAIGDVGSKDWAATAFGNASAPPMRGGRVATDDLLRLRDLGNLSLSPDGRWLVFSVRQADFKANDYQVRWFALRVGLTEAPVALEIDGGRPITKAVGGLPYGTVSPDPVKWSGDSSKFAFRRQVGDRIELWTVEIGSGAAMRVFDGAAQVESFAWSGANTLVFRTGLNVEKFRQAVESEGKRGWLLNQRMTLWAARSPSPGTPDCTANADQAGCDIRVLTADRDGIVRAASRAEVAALESDIAPERPMPTQPGASIGAVSDVSKPRPRAWTEAVALRASNALLPVRRLADDAPGPKRECEDPACQGQFIQAVGVTADRTAAWFLKRVSSTGDEARGPIDQVALFLRRFDSPAAKSLLVLDGTLDDCQSTGSLLLCKQSGTLTSERIVEISLQSGAVRVLADPNPAMSLKDMPKVRKIVLINPEGYRGFAQLVYPNEYVPGKSYPLVVVQYRATDFLRGGTGDEYPVLPLAAAGMFVLCIDKPEDLNALATLANPEVMKKNRDGQRDLRNVTTSIERAIDDLVAEGLVDPDRTAITGLSYGAEVVHYALQHSTRYAAAAASQGAMDLTYFAQFPEGELRDVFATGMGATSPLPEKGSTIMRAAWSQQPERLTTPLLLNVSQYEALFGFEGFAMLKAAGRPLEVRVFPDEGHIKYRPLSREGVYENNMLWLTYWLLGSKSSRSDLGDQYKRWDTLREHLADEKVRAKSAKH